MNQANNWIVFVRGNHDNPAYFEGTTFSYKRFIAVPDYTILQACNHSILCVGGAISIDRIYHINEWNKRQVIADAKSIANTLNKLKVSVVY